MLSNDKITAHNLARLLVLLVVITLSMVLATTTVSASDSDLDVSSIELGTVYVQVDGTRTPFAINGKTQVSEMLEALNIDLGETDKISKLPSQHLSKDDEIVIIRHGYSTIVEEGIIESKTIYTYSDEVTPGKETVLVQGRDGMGSHVIRQYAENGVVLEKTVVESNYSVEPIDTQIAVGFKTPPISGMSFDWEFNEDREPDNIVKVLRAQRSTAYTAKTGAKTASGRDAMVGHVAVNPNVIPYGSKLFIQSSDGNFIYGYAIAADTGGAMLSGAAGVDLYFDTMGECVSHGVKNVDIFVLETPSQ